MLKKLNKSNKGFTIIEVLIVLAIAALILLIVFLAVPALQRNSRNTQRTNDAARVGTAVSNWVSNNNGAVFTAGASNANLNAVLNDVGTLGQYTLTAGTNFTVVTGAQAAMTNLANIVVDTGAVCGTNGATTVTGASARSVVIQYAIESGSTTPTGRCVNV